MNFVFGSMHVGTAALKHTSRSNVMIASKSSEVISESSPTTLAAFAVLGISKSPESRLSGVTAGGIACDSQACSVAGFWGTTPVWGDKFCMTLLNTFTATSVCCHLPKYTCKLTRCQASSTLYQTWCCTQHQWLIIILQFSPQKSSSGISRRVGMFHLSS